MKYHLSIRDKEVTIQICDRCRKKVSQSQLNPITLDGTDDFYNIEICNECYEILGDYLLPKEVDKMFK